MVDDVFQVIVFVLRFNESNPHEFFERLDALKQFFLAHILVELIVCRLKLGCMHLPDPSYVSFVTAVITSVTALAGLAKVLLEKKRPSAYETAASNPSKKTLTPYFIK